MLRDRAVDDEGRVDGCRGGIDAVELEIRIGDRGEHGDQQFQCCGRRAGHDRVDDDFLHRAFDIAGQARHHLIRVAIILGQKAANPGIGRRNDGQSVAPALLDGELRERLDVQPGFVTAAGQPVDFAALRAAIAADQQFWRRYGAVRAGPDQFDAHAACSRAARVAVSVAPMVCRTPAKCASPIGSTSCFSCSFSG